MTLANPDAMPAPVLHDDHAPACEGGIGLFSE
jgi:hypothetical protein